MKKLSILIALFFCPHVEGKETSKAYIDLGLGITSVYGHLTPYSAAGSNIPPADYTREFYAHRFSTLRTGPKSSSFKLNTSLSVGYDIKIKNTPLMIGVFGSVGYRESTFQASHDGDNYKFSTSSSTSSGDLTGTSTLRRLDFSINTLNANGVASTALTSDPNNGSILSKANTTFATIDSGQLVANVKGNGGAITNFPATNFFTENNTQYAFLTNGGSGNIRGSGGKLTSLGSTPLTTQNNISFATIDCAVGGVTGNIRGNGSAVGTINTLASDVNLNQLSGVAETELKASVPNNGISDISLSSSGASASSNKPQIIREKQFVVFREKANFSGGFRIGVPKGAFFPHLRLGYNLLLMSAEIKRTNPETLDLDVYKVSKAVSALSLGLGVDFKVTSRFIVGATFDCSLGKKTCFDFSKKNILSAPGKVDHQLAVKLRPTVLTFMVTAKFAFPFKHFSV